VRGSENGVVIGIKEYQKIYEMLDKVSPVPYDCGAGCGSICCRDDSFDKDSEPYIYLLPGEKEYLEYAGADIIIRRERRKEHDLPASYGKYVYLACCSGPESCDRSHRPIQCRSFPLAPHYTEDGELILINCDEELPYVCPLIRDKTVLSDDFKKITLKAWKILAGDEAIRDLIIMDSKNRTDKETD